METNCLSMYNLEFASRVDYIKVSDYSSILIMASKRVKNFENLWYLCFVNF